MSKLIPQDVEDFLYDLGTRRDGSPGSFANYAKTAAGLLWDKYCILEDPSIEIMPRHSDRSRSSEHPPEN